jgi:uncharacterized Zn finger protein (UPF0148 family)
MLVRYDGTVVCRTCKTSYTIEMEPVAAPVQTTSAKMPEQLTGAARIQQLIREAKARSTHPIIRPTPIPEYDEDEKSIN